MKQEYDIRKRTLNYSIEIISFFRKRHHYDFIEQIILKQLIRAATSIGANVQEAKGAHSSKDYHNFFCIALKSANETKYWLEILLKTTTSDSDAINSLREEASEISKIIASCVIKMNK